MAEKKRPKAMKMKIRKGDQVEVNTGRDKG